MDPDDFDLLDITPMAHAPTCPSRRPHSDLGVTEIGCCTCGAFVVNAIAEQMRDMREVMRRRNALAARCAELEDRVEELTAESARLRAVVDAAVEVRRSASPTSLDRLAAAVDRWEARCG